MDIRRTQATGFYSGTTSTLRNEFSLIFPLVQLFQKTHPLTLLFELDR
ncbi:hypothetical protein OIU77_001664 [Salix suchowensis]|uniref:Uncharacterized protein n=1 Tax=Salix suchowensis TaxID=1278906 RepID=A0ABQ9B3W7_9ROSI|nr:hypothetical protein OIU77_001664 [Salix suchowensis]